MTKPTVLEICAGGGGQSLGLEQAGFEHVAAVEIDPDASLTLRRNRPGWYVIEDDVANVDGRSYRGVDLLAGGVPCPPFSIAGKQLGEMDERDLFPQAVRLADEARPSAIMIENVRGLAGKKFEDYRSRLIANLTSLGYQVTWQVLNASDFRVPQLRPRFVLVALRRGLFESFRWPRPEGEPPSVGAVIGDLMGEGGWPWTKDWIEAANGIAPTIVGGSKKHGGPDLGPTRARDQWKKLRVDGLGLADVPPSPEFPRDGLPRLTNRMVARIQGFPDEWIFAGGKTTAYRQIGNAFPPPVARRLGESIRAAMNARKSYVIGQMPLPDLASTVAS